jgi:antitoxin PrlF
MGLICNCIVKKPYAYFRPGTEKLHATPYVTGTSHDWHRRRPVLDISNIPYYYVRSGEIENTMAVATLTSKGQITIPSQVRHALGLEAGDRVDFVEQGKGQFAIVAATRSVQELKGLFQGKRSKPVSIEEMNAAIARRASGFR